MSAECDCNTNSVKQCCKSEISKCVVKVKSVKQDCETSENEITAVCML